MMHKLRAGMGSRDPLYELSGQMELDDGFFTTRIPDGEKNEPLKKRRGSQRNSKVLVMTERQTVNCPKLGGKAKKLEYLKMNK